MGTSARMALLHDELFHFNGANGVPSQCRVRVFTPPADSKASGYIVILTDDQDAEGVSVTNAADRLGALLCARFHIPPERTQFLEHYDYRHWRDGHDGGGHEQLFAVIHFRTPASTQARADFINETSLGEPRWSHIAKSDVETLIGEPLP